MHAFTFLVSQFVQYYGDGDYWVCGLNPLSRILEEHKVSVTGSASVLSWQNGETYIVLSWISSDRSGDLNELSLNDPFEEMFPYISPDNENMSSFQNAVLF